MTKIVLEIDNDKDTRLFLDLAERLNVKFKTNFLENTEKVEKQLQEKADLTSDDLHKIVYHGKGLSFLEEEEENIYTDKHLKVKF